ncbi:uncharacterized protein LOC128874624 [Hylaeus volcanicus]|uniref:uncharacterized protein LOC128874624 n=1 Tax=Hylaeus volcanicus TaxID=313075 RepID=UPI0023B87F1D|nr:uncharacterized protein LOC128874624 [Hylaeus volcanicus]XP_053975503.1 uncharacterized protein LOC128874624 [Hylaeus volcanicus]
MSITPSPELLTEAAGVKIFMTPLAEEECSSCESLISGKICVMLENVNDIKSHGKSFGFHLTKSKWDPYPWVSYVDIGSLADTAGLRAGDCLMTINGKDLIGLKIQEIATLIHYHQEYNIKLFIWRCSNEESKEEGIAVKGPLPDVAIKLANAVSGVVRTLECPVCLESSTPPVSQCVHGHIICVGCRPRTPRCPVCRVRLGQGRCLLADKLHKIFREVFDIKENSSKSTECQTWNLRDRLFGKSKKKHVPSVTPKSNGPILRARQLLLNKLFFGGVEKAASADNLTVISNGTSSVNETSLNGTNINNLSFDERLSLHDRAKSASTGELSKERMKNVIDDRLQIGTSKIMSSTTSLSSIPPTPVWGGSMDSVSCIQITCPLSKQSDCKDIITSDTLMEHLSGFHEVPQVHFYSVHVQIPLPLPFGSEAAYILHSSGDLFFFQCDEETVWIACATGGKNSWEWSLHGQGENGTEIKIRKSVASLENPMILSSQHIAPLPNSLLLHTLNIQLLECRSHEQLGL